MPVFSHRVKSSHGPRIRPLQRAVRGVHPRANCQPSLLGSHDYGRVKPAFVLRARTHSTTVTSLAGLTFQIRCRRCHWGTGGQSLASGPETVGSSRNQHSCCLATDIATLGQERGRACGSTSPRTARVGHLFVAAGDNTSEAACPLDPGRYHTCEHSHDQLPSRREASTGG